MLLHGTNSSRSIWKPLLPHLSDQREVFSVDLPAHGQSPPSSFTPPDWAKEVAVLLDHLGLERVAVVGHSAGGWTALELAKLGRAAVFWRSPRQDYGASIRRRSPMPSCSSTGGSVRSSARARSPSHCTPGWDAGCRYDRSPHNPQMFPPRMPSRWSRQCLRPSTSPNTSGKPRRLRFLERSADPVRHPSPHRLGQQGPHRPHPNLAPHRPTPQTRNRRNMAQLWPHAHMGRPTTSHRRGPRHTGQRSQRPRDCSHVTTQTSPHRQCRVCRRWLRTTRYGQLASKSAPSPPDAS